MASVRSPLDHESTNPYEIVGRYIAQMVLIEYMVNALIGTLTLVARRHGRDLDDPRPGWTLGRRIDHLRTVIAANDLPAPHTELASKLSVVNKRQAKSGHRLFSSQGDAWRIYSPWTDEEAPLTDDERRGGAGRD